MPVRIFTLPFDASRELFQEEELNRFCLNRQVTQRRAEFFAWQGKAWWTVWLEYDEAEQAQPLPPELDERQQSRFKRLREWRFSEAERKGLPAYVIATNRQLEEMARQNPRSLEALRSIHGIGKTKVQRYGKTLLELLREDAIAVTEGAARSALAAAPDSSLTSGGKGEAKVMEEGETLIDVDQESPAAAARSTGEADEC
jgi:ribonuclease D